MTRLRWVFIAITTISFIGIVSAVSDYIGLPPGPYCGAIHRGCCPGRVDDCSAPIIGIPIVHFYDTKGLLFV